MKENKNDNSDQSVSQSKEFRVWTGLEKTNKYWSGNGMVYLEKNNCCDRDSISFENESMMQYTGLKDKNGVEIYEGDIIKCSATQREYDIMEDKIVQVKYLQGYFYPFGYNAGWRSSVYDIEILGNIYQNSELLSE